MGYIIVQSNKQIKENRFSELHFGEIFESNLPSSKTFLKLDDAIEDNKGKAYCFQTNDFYTFRQFDVVKRIKGTLLIVEDPI